MWCEAGHDPDAFWRQTPRTFRLVMEAARTRVLAEHESRISLAYHTALFNAGTKTKGGLKPLEYYLKRKPKKQSLEQMRSNLMLIASRVNRIYKDKPDGE